MGRKLKSGANRFSGWSAYRSSPPEHNTRKRKSKKSEDTILAIAFIIVVYFVLKIIAMFL
jgi:hypothetical protein